MSAGQPHEGSCYAAQKDMQMAFHRQEHVKSRLAELDRLRAEHLQEQQQQQQVDTKPFGLTDASSSWYSITSDALNAHLWLSLAKHGVTTRSEIPEKSMDGNNVEGLLGHGTKWGKKLGLRVSRKFFAQ